MQNNKTINELKNELREKNKILRKINFSKEMNFAVIENIRHTKEYKKAKNILAFYPLKYEIDLRSLFIDNLDKKNWFLPKMQGETMIVATFSGEENLTCGRFNVKEPPSKNEVSADILDLIILPALSCDKTGNRLGYGKGCYDKFLSSLNRKVVCILPIFSCLITENVPTDKFDQKTDIIVSEKEVFYVRKY